MYKFLAVSKEYYSNDYIFVKNLKSYNEWFRDNLTEVTTIREHGQFYGNIKFAFEKEEDRNLFILMHSDKFITG